LAPARLSFYRRRGFYFAAGRVFLLPPARLLFCRWQGFYFAAKMFATVGAFILFISTTGNYGKLIAG